MRTRVLSVTREVDAFSAAARGSGRPAWVFAFSARSPAGAARADSAAPTTFRRSAIDVSASRAHALGGRQGTRPGAFPVLGLRRELWLTVDRGDLVDVDHHVHSCSPPVETALFGLRLQEAPPAGRGVHRLQQLFVDASVEVERRSIGHLQHVFHGPLDVRMRAALPMLVMGGWPALDLDPDSRWRSISTPICRSL